MRIAMIGGLDRNERRIEELARALGHELSFHTGRIGGRGTDALESLVARSDVVICAIDITSHGAVQQAKRAAREHGRHVLVLRTGGLSRIRAVLAELADETAPLRSVA